MQDRVMDVRSQGKRETQSTTGVISAAKSWGDRMDSISLKPQLNVTSDPA